MKTFEITIDSPADVACSMKADITNILAQREDGIAQLIGSMPKVD